MAPVTAVVLSDLHATSTKPGDKAGSWLTTGTQHDPREHPLIGITKYFVDRDLKADLLLVAGDICDKADEAALMMAWARLNELAGVLGAKLIATAGNHDLKSRDDSDEIDPRGLLYDLDPPFPAGDSETRDGYWARNYAVVDSPLQNSTAAARWRVVTLNSAAFHGYKSGGELELEHGRVTQRTTRRLHNDISALPESELSILLVHHHLMQLPHVDTAEKSQIKDADLLVDLIDEHSPWIVIHGHKHRARILYAPGESSAPVFSAASMSAFPIEKSATGGVTNQAYILRFAEESELELHELGVAGEFEALDWVPGSGWKRAAANSGMTLPGFGGFGWKPDSARLSRRLIKALAESGETRFNRDDLLRIEPKLRYLSPAGIQYLRDKIQATNAKTELKCDEHGAIDQLVTKISLGDEE